MTQDEILQMAKAAGGTAYVNRHYLGETAFAFGPKAFKDFVNLLTEKATEEANARANASWSLMCKKMVEAEREACAKVCDGMNGSDWSPSQCAAAILARGKEC